MIDYQEVLKDLDSKRSAARAELESTCARFDAAIATIQGILRSNGNGSNGHSQAVLTEPSDPNNLRAAVLKFLAKEPMRTYTPKAISLATGLPEKPVRNMIKRLADRKKIERPRRGTYRYGKSHEAAAA